MDCTALDRRQALRLQADAVVRRHYRRDLTITAVATLLGVSARTLQRAYAETDGAFEQTLARVRAAAGAELLAEQPLAVGDVARLVGYRHAAAFARAFRRSYGVTPGAFRAAARRRGAIGER